MMMVLVRGEKSVVYTTKWGNKVYRVEWDLVLLSTLATPMTYLKHSSPMEIHLVGMMMVLVWGVCVLILVEWEADMDTVVLAVSLGWEVWEDSAACPGGNGNQINHLQFLLVQLFILATLMHKNSTTFKAQLPHSPATALRLTSQ